MNLEECFNYISIKLNLKIYTEEQPKTIRAYAIHQKNRHGSPYLQVWGGSAVRR